MEPDKSIELLKPNQNMKPMVKDQLMEIMRAFSKKED